MLLILRNKSKAARTTALIRQLTGRIGVRSVSTKPLIYDAQFEDEDGGEGQAHNIVTMLECFKFRSHRCFVFPILWYESVRVLEGFKISGLGLGQVRKVALQLLKALRHLKSLGIVHCDIKPENVLLKNSPRDGGTTIDEGGMEVVLCDFGSSCCVGSSFPSYMQSRFCRAPEVVLRLSHETEIVKKMYQMVQTRTIICVKYLAP